LPAARDAAVAASAYLRGASASLGNDAPAALQFFEEFIRLRPASAVGHRDAAGQLRALDRLDEAQHTYARALALEPLNVSARVLYGQLLADRVLPKSAEEHLRFAWERGTDGNAAIIPLYNLLSGQGRDGECLELLDAALDRNSLDGHLWNYVGQSRRAMNDHAAAASAFARAAELLPDLENLRVQAAEQFEASGQPAKAEESYRILIDRHASAASHYRYARFISRDAARRDEALRSATRALQLADDPSAPPREMIQSLIAAIRSGKASKRDDLHL
jgi:tetratricopeptide (TPR) repeat protein